MGSALILRLVLFAVIDFLPLLHLTTVALFTVGGHLLCTVDEFSSLVLVEHVRWVTMCACLMPAFSVDFCGKGLLFAINANPIR